MLSGLDTSQAVSPFAAESQNIMYESKRAMTPDPPGLLQYNSSLLTEESSASRDRQLLLPFSSRYELNPRYIDTPKLPLVPQVHLNLDASRHALESRLSLLPHYCFSTDAALGISRLQENILAGNNNLVTPSYSVLQPARTTDLTVMEESRYVSMPFISDSRSLRDNKHEDAIIACPYPPLLAIEDTPRETGRYLSYGSEIEGRTGYLSGLKAHLPNHKIEPASSPEDSAINLSLTASSHVKRKDSEDGARSLQPVKFDIRQNIPKLRGHENGTLRSEDMGERMFVLPRSPSPGRISFPVLPSATYLKSITAPGAVSVPAVLLNPTQRDPPSSFIYPNIFPHNSSQIIVPARDKAFDVLTEANSYEDKCYTIFNQSRSSTERNYFKRRLSSSRSLEEKPQQVIKPVRQASDDVCDRHGLGERLHSKYQYLKNPETATNRRLEKPIPISLPSWHVFDRKMVDIDMADVALRSDVIHYPVAASVSSASSHGCRSDSSRSPLSRRSSEEHYEHISVWRPY